MLPEVKEERQMDQKRSLISKCQKYKLKREREREGVKGVCANTDA